MLKETLAVGCAFIFLGVLSSVVGDVGVSANNFGDESFPFVVSTFKDKCPDDISPLICNYWDSLTYRPNKQINELENRTENETAEENAQEISLEPPFITADNHINKRFIVFRRKNPIARGYKRGPGFRSWGGKRGQVLSGNDFDKRTKFVSWGGKRDGEFLPDDLTSSDLETRDKKPKFQNWGGKKSSNDFLEEFGNEKEKRAIWKERYYLGEPFKKHVPKRPQFQSWGGKRGVYPWHGFFEFLHSQPRFLLNAGEKRKFSSWGGKRYDSDEDVHWMKTPEENFRHGWMEKTSSSDMDVPDGFEMKESESSERTRQRDKRKTNSNWEDDGNHSNLDSSGDEIRNEKNRR